MPQDNQDHFRWGVIGPGNIAKRFAAALAAVAGRTPGGRVRARRGQGSGLCRPVGPAREALRVDDAARRAAGRRGRGLYRHAPFPPCRVRARRAAGGHAGAVREAAGDDARARPAAGGPVARARRVPDGGAVDAPSCRPTSWPAAGCARVPSASCAPSARRSASRPATTRSTARGTRRWRGARCGTSASTTSPRRAGRCNR